MKSQGKNKVRSQNKQTKVQNFLIIRRIYNCSNLPFSVTIL